MVNQETIRKFKEKYGSVYLTEYDNQVFVWRMLTRGEYNKAINLYDDEIEREDYVCSLCVLSPEDYDFSGANGGYASSLCNEILSNSLMAPNSAINMLGQYRTQMEDFDKQVPIIIITAFPQYTFEDIENWTMEQTLERLAQAEWALQNIHGYGFQIDLDGTQTAQTKSQNPFGISGEHADVNDFPELRQEARVLKRMKR